MSPMMCGGPSQAADADVKIQQLCDFVRPDIEAKMKSTYTIFAAKTYTKQVVAGTNYFIKVQVEEDDYIHIRVFERLPHNGGGFQAHGLQESKKLTDPVEYIKQDQWPAPKI